MIHIFLCLDLYSTHTIRDRRVRERVKKVSLGNLRGLGVPVLLTGVKEENLS